MSESVIKCNKCGKAFDEYDKREGLHICKLMGYGSVYDEDVIDMHLCLDCVDELIRSCVLSPVEGNVEDVLWNQNNDDNTSTRLEF